MSDAFVRGGSGDIRFDQLPAAKGRSFFPLHEQKLSADLYEAEHPEVTVIRPWESKEEHEARKEKRKVTKLAEPELQMSPDRARRELRLKTAELQTLPLDHPKYSEMFDAAVRLIHQYEDILNLTHTRYVKGITPKKAEDAPVPPELIEKLAQYKKLSTEKRRDSISKGKNIDMLVLVSAHETDAELQQLVTERIGQLAMAKQETVVT
jgi:hypothetical protein